MQSLDVLYFEQLNGPVCHGGILIKGELSRKLLALLEQALLCPMMTGLWHYGQFALSKIVITFINSCCSVTGIMAILHKVAIKEVIKLMVSSRMNQSPNGKKTPYVVVLYLSHQSVYFGMPFRCIRAAALKDECAQED